MSYESEHCLKQIQVAKRPAIGAMYSYFVSHPPSTPEALARRQEYADLLDYLLQLEEENTKLRCLLRGRRSLERSL